MSTRIGSRSGERHLHLSAICMAIAAAVTACGGSNTSPGKTEVITLSGVAATGAPMTGAIIVVKDSTNTEVQSCEPCTVGPDGNFSIPLKTTATKGPFVLYATQEGGSEPEVSVIDTQASTTVNVSPITTLIAARLAKDGDPAKLSSANLTGDKINQATAEVKTALKPLLDAAGVDTNANPVTMAFKADGTGLDKALDVMGKPNIIRSSDGTTQVEIEIKTSGSDSATDGDNAPAKITLTAGTAPVSTGLTADKVHAALPADGMSMKIKDVMQRMQDCYGTAPSDRRPAGATLASQITAPVCKNLFVDNDPAKYLHNNTVVSQVGATLPAEQIGRFTGAFKGIFNTVQGIKFDLPEYRYTIKNGNTTDATKPMQGDVVFTARWTVTDPNAGIYLGQTDVGEYQARLQNGELKLFGNQSKHDLNINAQARREEMPAVSNYAYLATGYNIGISERRWNHDDNSSTAKVSIYEQVRVTSPNGKTFLFKPIPGNNYDYLGLVRPAGSISSTATIRLNGAYQNSATTGHPSERFTKEFWAAPADWADEKIAAIPAQGNWKFDITLTDAFVAANASSGTTKNFTQYRRSINRAPTLAELKGVKWPTLKDPMKSSLSSAATSQGYVGIGSNNSPATLVIDGWDVASGAWAPTYAKVYGSNWDEGADVASSARKVTIACAGGSQCEKNASNVNTGKFINTGWGYLQFTGRDSKRLQMSLNYSTRQTAMDNNN